MRKRTAAKQASTSGIPSWPDAGARPPMGSAQEPAFLRMCSPDTPPHAGSLPSDELDLDGPWHFHDMHQLICAFEGSIEVEVEGGRHLIPRELAAWVPANIPHRVSLHKVKSGSIFFPMAMIASPGDRIRALLVSPLMREMARQAMRWPLSGPESALRTAFFEAMAGFCSEWIEQEADLYLPMSSDPRIQRAMDYASEHLDGQLADVCRHAGMSERSLRRNLKHAAGMTLNEFRNRSRLIRAVSLLSESDRSVAEIAFDCGFESPSAFARAFRATMRENPSAYRDRMGRSS